MRIAIRISVLCSLIVAVVFVMTWRYYPNMPVDLAVQIENIQLVLWPSSIFILAAVPGSTGEHLFLYGATIISNLVLYGLIGAALWNGFKRRIWWPATGLAVVLCLIWLRVLTLA